MGVETAATYPFPTRDNLADAGPSSSWQAGGKKKGRKGKKAAAAAKPKPKLPTTVAEAKSQGYTVRTVKRHYINRGAKGKRYLTE